MTDEKSEPTTEGDPEAKEPESEEQPESSGPTRTPKPPGKSEIKPSNQDMITSLQLLRNAENAVRRVIEIGAVSVAGNLVGTIRAARKRAESGTPLLKGGNLG